MPTTPTNSHARALRGALRGDKNHKPPAATTGAGAGEPPEHLSERQRLLWAELGAAAGWCGPVDRAALEVATLALEALRRGPTSAPLLRAVSSALADLALTPRSRGACSTLPAWPGRLTDDAAAEEAALLAKYFDE